MKKNVMVITHKGAQFAGIDNLYSACICELANNGFKFIGRIYIDGIFWTCHMKDSVIHAFDTAEDIAQFLEEEGTPAYF